jgi:hypothetical protein
LGDESEKRFLYQQAGSGCNPKLEGLLRPVPPTGKAGETAGIGEKYSFFSFSFPVYGLLASSLSSLPAC